MLEPTMRSIFSNLVAALVLVLQLFCLSHASVVLVLLATAPVLGESPMQPADGVNSGFEVSATHESPSAPQHYATTAPVCGSDSPLLQKYRADAPFEGLPQVLLDAFTMDGQRDLWILADCPAVEEALRPLECVPQCEILLNVPVGSGCVRGTDCRAA